MIILYTGIIIHPYGAAKYRNINNLDKFEKFAIAKFPLLTAINFYTKEDKKFFKQVRF